MSDFQKKEGPPSVINRSEDRPVTVYMVLGFLMIIAVFVFNANNWLGPKSQPSDEEIKSEFIKIIVPAGAVAEQEVKLESKTGSVSVSNRYIANFSKEVVFSEYRKELNRNSWVYNMDFGDGIRVGQDYCKGNLLASVEIISSNAEQTKYDLSVHWSGVSERECQ